ncbi:MAG: hypothetical protein PF450_07080 [Bacteroidales bacterium]|jgi:hypothetical protein|nr:hypothetical protein [Bacteroidales bacterium]
MKKLITNIALIFVPLLLAYGQQEISYRKLVDEATVPKEVRFAFKKMYPKAFVALYYSSHITYWYEDYSPSWYGDWYPSRTVVVHRLEKPAYYEVDFQFEGNPSRAIFNRYGQWFETRSRIKTLPDSVAQGLKQSEFGTWLWSPQKEQIIMPGYNGIIYRLQVRDRKESYLIRLNEAGEIIQVKYE